MQKYGLKNVAEKKFI